MKVLYTTLILSVLIFLGLSFSFKNHSTELESTNLLNAVSDSIRLIKNMSFTLVNQERIDGKILKGTQKITLTTSPFQCYVLMVEPGKGQELVYAGAKYDYQAVYEPNGFPYIQLKLDPYGSLMRNKNHQTIFHLGFEKMMNIIKEHMNNSKYSISSEDALYNKKKATKINIEFINFGYTYITTEREERLHALAERMSLNDYMISTLNDIDIDETISKGSKLKVPNAYAKKIELYIEISTGLPMAQVVYDDEGLYEKYDFFDLKINQFIPMNRFDSKSLGKQL